MTATKPAKEFSERKKLIELQSKYDIEKHERSMEELKFRRETDRLHHERELERGRIKSAEIRKAQQRRSDQRFAEGYGKNQY